MNYKDAPWKLAENLDAKAFKGEAMRLFDLFDAAARSGSPVIEDRSFVDCRLEGPAVIAILSGCQFVRTDFGYPGDDLGRIVWRTESRKGVVGALPFRNCRFEGCSFFATGFTGPEDFLQQILKLDRS